MFNNDLKSILAKSVGEAPFATLRVERDKSSCDCQCAFIGDYLSDRNYIVTDNASANLTRTVSEDIAS